MRNEIDTSKTKGVTSFVPINLNSIHENRKIVCATADWLENLCTSGHELLCLTVVFKPKDRNNNRERWESEYRKSVLGKINRRLGAHIASNRTAILFDDFRFESDSSVIRTGGSRKPSHVHGFLLFPKSQLYRLWDVENHRLSERLQKDLTSINTVQQFKAELVVKGKIRDWLNYIYKTDFIKKWASY